MLSATSGVSTDSGVGVSAMTDRSGSEVSGVDFISGGKAWSVPVGAGTWVGVGLLSAGGRLGKGMSLHPARATRNSGPANKSLSKIIFGQPRIPGIRDLLRPERDKFPGSMAS